MSTTVLVETKVFGQKRPMADWEAPIPDIRAGERRRLRDLISDIVLDEVRAFQERQESLKLIRVLSAAQVQAGVERGKINPDGGELGQTVAPENTIDTALVAFTDGLYFVFIDGVQQTELDAEVFLKRDSRVLFLRLTPLAGG